MCVTVTAAVKKFFFFLILVRVADGLKVCQNLSITGLTHALPQVLGNRKVHEAMQHNDTAAREARLDIYRIFFSLLHFHQRKRKRDPIFTAQIICDVAFSSTLENADHFILRESNGCVFVNIRDNVLVFQLAGDTFFEPKRRFIL